MLTQHAASRGVVLLRAWGRAVAARMTRRAATVWPRALLAGGIAAACAVGAAPRPRPSAPSPPSAPDAGPPVKRKPRPVPPPPTDEYPYVGIFNGYVEAFRREEMDEAWAKPTKTILKEQLTDLDPNVVRVRLLECRCGLCMLGFIIAPGGEGPNPQPGVDYPAVRWSGYEKHMRGMRADQWAEGLVFLGRHPKDSPTSSPRVRSTDSPWTDPACELAIPFPPTWETDGRSSWTGIGINRMYLAPMPMPAKRVCPCLCGKLRLDSSGACKYQTGGSVYCPLSSFTERGLPIIDGDWSCKRTEPSTSR